MSAPARHLGRSPPGLDRSARLMRALGPGAAPIWAQLTPGEAEALGGAMDRLADDPAADDEAVRRFAQAQPAAGAAGVWAQLSALGTPLLASLLSGERPQVAALILSRLSGEAAARALRALPPAVSVEAMQFLLHLGEAHPGALAGLEEYLKGRAAALSQAGAGSGAERIARIFDRLDPRAGTLFLAALDNAEPGSGEKVRSLMFTFDDLAALSPGAMQTLLAGAGRGVLVLALKGAREATAAAVFANLTARAGDLLREEIAGLGPVRRSDVEAARAQLLELARELTRRGDIRIGKASRGDELIE